MTKQLRGGDYVAARRISNAANETLAAPGQTCERVPQESLADLASDGSIVPKAGAGSGVSKATALLGEPSEILPIAPERRSTKKGV